MFPLNELPNIEKSPEDYRLLKRVPWTHAAASFPMVITEAAGNVSPFVWLDTETTGLDANKDKVIELGLVKGFVDPEGRVTGITARVSLYEDPGFPLPPLITDLTGITDAMVRGKTMDSLQVSGWFDDDPIVVAHNAGFDRAFFEARFPGLDQLRWACSIKDIPWKRLGFESSKLEYLLLKQGYFYEGHRASTDALATAYLMHVVPDAAKYLIEAERGVRVHIEAVGCPFDSKDSLKARGYRWNPDKRVWHTEIDETYLDEESAYLSQLYPSGGDRAIKTPLTSRHRYKAQE